MMVNSFVVHKTPWF